MDSDRLDESIEYACSGSAVCFLGSGFSILAKDSSGVDFVPSTTELTNELWNLAETPVEPGANLADIADFFTTTARAQALRTHLLKRLTLSNPAVAQLDLLSVPWRSIFTTNFDDVVERCIPADKRQIVTPSARSRVIRTDICPVYYVHGRALDLLEGDSDPGMVLSETNYLELKSRNVELYATFVNEIHAASKVFFIGYSIKDAEIASRIFALGDTLRQKSVVVCREGEGEVAISRLKKFGEVYPIGVEGANARFSNIRSRFDGGRSRKDLVYLRPVVRVLEKTEVSKEDVDRLIITGEFDLASYATQKSGADPSNLYCVDHAERMDELFKSMDGLTNRFLVTSDVGNGKSTFLKQLIYEAASRDFSVFEISAVLPEVFGDVDSILSSKSKVIFVIDDLIRHRNIAEYIGKRLHSNSFLICATRDSYDALSFSTAVDLLSGAVREIQVDRLTPNQLIQWDALLERWGYWEGKIELDSVSRREFLRADCASENRSIVVSLFKSSYLSKKISSIVTYFVNKNPHHLKAFVAIIVASLCQKHVRWDQIVEWLRIDEDGLRRSLEKEQIFDFLMGRREWYSFTSTQLADHILRNYEFDGNVVVDVYTTIVRETAYSSSDARSGGESRENLKELMKFRFLGRLFGNGVDAATSIEAVYSRLSKVPKIRQNDQFWLQYAMSCIERRDLTNAETYIGTALGIASKKGADYYDDQIVDQKIRLAFLKNARTDVRVNTDEISKAVEELTYSLRESNPMHIYPMRSATYILDFLDERVEDISVDLRKSILAVLDRMRDVLKQSPNLPKAQRGETRKLADDVRKARLILQNA